MRRKARRMRAVARASHLPPREQWCRSCGKKFEAGATLAFNWKHPVHADELEHQPLITFSLC